MTEPLRILIVEDVATDAEIALAELRRAGMAVVPRRVETEGEFLAELQRFDPDLILSDYSMPVFTGLEALRLARERAPELPFIVYTGSLNEETAVACMKAGAWDYVLKDRLSRLPLAVAAALELASTRRERAASEQALRESEERYRREHALLRALIDSIPDQIFVKDANSTYRDCNRAFADFSGVAREKLIGESDAAVVPPADAEAFVAVDRSVLSSGRPWRGEVASVFASSPGRIFDTVKTPYYGPGGELLGLIGISRDISERKQFEAQLRQWADAFESCAHGIALDLPSTNRILACNPAFARMLGRSVEEVNGTPILDACAPGAHDHLRACIAEADRTGQVRYEARMLRADGSQVPVQMDVVSVRSPGGDLLYRVATAQDISLRREVEASLKESEARYRGLVETSFDWIWEVDAEGRYTYASPRIGEILGYTAEEVIGRTPFDLMPEDEAVRVGEKFAAIAARREPFAFLENVNRHRDGRLVVLETSGVPVLGPDGELLGYRGTDRDVTERRRLQQQLNQAQKLEAVGRLAGGIAHDFNNLLQAMLSHTAVMRHEGKTGLLSDPLGEMEQLVRRGAALTRQLLLFSRQEAVAPLNLDLNEVVRGAATLLRRIVRENVAMVTDLADDALPVLADRGQIDQVLMNLAVNASDAMPDGGTITLRSGALAESVWLAVSDTGHGIPEELRPQIFEPFFTTKPSGKGTGLGLSVVHGIVSAHGGRVDVAGSAGGGAQFTIWLPLATAAGPVSASAPDLPDVPARGAGERVLVVEDEDGAREALATLLEILGYAVTAFGSGEAALRLPVEPGFDVLLTDLVLPGVTGHELAAEMRSRWPGLRVVVMSGYTEDEASRQEVAKARDHFLQKPFDTAALAATIRHALDAPAAD